MYRSGRTSQGANQQALGGDEPSVGESMKFTPPLQGCSTTPPYSVDPTPSQADISVEDPISEDGTPTTSLSCQASTPDHHSSPSRMLAKRAHSSGGIFDHARDFVVSNSTIVNYEGRSGAGHHERARRAMEMLRAKRTPGAEVDSSERYPPPRCHPETRKTTRSAIKDWLSNASREQNMYWLLGAAGVGKSAIAQTVAEEARALGQFGAGFFFSRPNHRDDPRGLVPTLVHQLALRFPPYKQLIADLLDDDPTILEKDLESQFRLLILEPFNNFQRTCAVPHTHLVVIDGLDECRDKGAQQTFIQLFSDCARQKGCLAFLVCSRPEWHLTHLKPDQSPNIYGICDELLVNGVEGRDDVYRFICDEFVAIRSRYSYELAPDWPGENVIVSIAEASSGHFAFASAAMGFVGVDPPGNPASQLKILLRIIDKMAVADVNPMGVLDALYLEILNLINSSVRFDAFKILALHFFAQDLANISYNYDPDRPPNSITLVDIANILAIDRAASYAALRGLHSVMEIPKVEDAHKFGLNVYHSSFTDFLSDYGRSGGFRSLLQKAAGVVVYQFFRWLDKVEARNCDIEGSPCPIPDLSPVWIPPIARSDIVELRMKTISSKLAWTACQQLDKHASDQLLLALESISFCHFRRDYGRPIDVLIFMRWLKRESNLLRIKQTSRGDRALLARTGVKLDRSSLLPIAADAVRIHSTHLNRNNCEWNNTGYLSFILGHSERACVISFHVRDDDSSKVHNMMLKEPNPQWPSSPPWLITLPISPEPDLEPDPEPLPDSQTQLNRRRRVTWRVMRALSRFGFRRAR